MSNWVSAHEELYNGVFNMVYQSPLKAKVNSVEDGVKKELVTPYIVIGETNVTESVTSTSMREDIAVQMHVYADSKPECRELMKWLKFYTRVKIPMEHYEVEKIRLSNEQMMTDIDQYTAHGVLRLVYTVRHHVLYRNEN
ncbi:tail completion protein gp17 [Salinicoccus roseus]|uniref:DUF3168 domain-containing protein n=1 Tax=Salinicoccus roseus TaxID=45670 RepID=A0A0C2E3C4_9STAP|nr:DUF3168 domain-containing protein [Salinicoccus roseus]KIH69942.1 hypothetical protein SN16_10540 [Salinicoccus roseus]MDB0581238.1 DUF3168 domain-containing protein [Salinicoccus roseus]